MLRRKTHDPAGQPAHLIVTGAHAWSRNPMHLSLTIICAGIALAMGNVWPLVLVVLPWAAMNWVVIPSRNRAFEKPLAKTTLTIVEGFGAGCEAALLARSLTRDLGAGLSAALLSAPIARWLHF